MVTITLLRALSCLCIFVGTSVSRPSIDYGSFDDGSILPLGGMLHARSEPIEIRGVYGGRKKRYVIERAPAPNPKACCVNGKKEKEKCKAPKTWNSRKCKCLKCAVGKKDCDDECPKGEKEDEKTGKCVEDKTQCKLGEKKDPADPKHERCIKDPKECKKGYTMDPKIEQCVKGDKLKEEEEKKKKEEEKKKKEEEEKKKKKEEEEKKKKEEEEKKKKEEEEKKKKELDLKNNALGTKSACEAVLWFVQAAESKGKNKKRADEPTGYFYSTLYHEESYIQADSTLKQLGDIDLNKIAKDVDSDAWLKYWAKIIDDKKPIYTGGCNWTKRSSLDPRCSPRRSVDEQNGDTGPDEEHDWLDAVSHNTTALTHRDSGPGNEPAMTADDLKERFDALEARNLSDIERRQLGAFVGLFTRLSSWGARAAQATIRSSAAARVANSSPELLELMKDGKKLFQVAQNGKGTSKSPQASAKTSRTIQEKKGDMLKECLRTGAPPS